MLGQAPEVVPEEDVSPGAAAKEGDHLGAGPAESLDSTLHGVEGILVGAVEIFRHVDEATVIQHKDIQ